MRLRTIGIALAIAAPLLAFESTPAAAFGWCDWGWGTRTYGYTAPRSYGYYGYAPRTYGYYGYAAPRRFGYYGYAPSYRGFYYGRRLGWRGYGYRGWRGHGFRAGWRGYGYRPGLRGHGAAFRGAHVGGFRGGVRAGRR
jgi:hypothetical protein